MKNIQQRVEACYLTRSSERCEGKREEAGEEKLKQKHGEKAKQQWRVGESRLLKGFKDGNLEKEAVMRGNYSE